MMARNNTKKRENLNRPTHSILRGADRNDLAEIETALATDPQCINAKDEHIGVTALHIAAADGNKSLVEFLIKQPACQLDVEDAAGRTPAMLAFLIGRDDIVGLLASATSRELQAQFPELRNAPQRAKSRSSGKSLILPKPPRPKEP